MLDRYHMTWGLLAYLIFCMESEFRDKIDKILCS